MQERDLLLGYYCYRLLSIVALAAYILIDPLC